MPLKSRTGNNRLAALQERQRNFIQCYTLGHQWDEWPQDDWMPDWKSLQYRPVSFRCASCGTIRREYWNRTTGELSFNPGRRYIYPDGYLLGHLDLPNDMTKRETMRVEFLGRLPETD